MVEVTTELMRRVDARLRAYIRPNIPAPGSQAEAFEAAAACQARYEAEHADAIDAASRGVQSFSLGGYSESYFEGRAGGEIPVCPEARALLQNAGLLARSWPTARRAL